MTRSHKDTGVMTSVLGEPKFDTFMLNQSFLFKVNANWVQFLTPKNTH